MVSLFCSVQGLLIHFMHLFDTCLLHHAASVIIVFHPHRPVQHCRFHCFTQQCMFTIFTPDGCMYSYMLIRDEDEVLAGEYQHHVSRVVCRACSQPLSCSSVSGHEACWFIGKSAFVELVLWFRNMSCHVPPDHGCMERYCSTFTMMSPCSSLPETGAVVFTHAFHVRAFLRRGRFCPFVPNPSIMV